MGLLTAPLRGRFGFTVAFFGTADVACFDRDGTQVWARNLGRPESMYGLASSLSFHEGKVILQLDQGESAEDGLSSIMALAIATGRVLWETPRPVPNSWPSPVVIRTPSRDAIITCANPFVIAYSPADGTELWRAGGLSGDVGPSPVYADGMVYATNDGAQLLAIQTGGSGDVSETHVKWSDYEGMPDTASPICDGRFFLQATSNGGVSCYDAKSGKRLWDEEIGDGCNASPSLDGSTVYLLETEGVMHIFELGAEYKAGAKSALGERAGASPAFVDGRIYIRGEDHLFCIGKKD